MRLRDPLRPGLVFAMALLLAGAPGCTRFDEVLQREQRALSPPLPAARIDLGASEYRLERATPEGDRHGLDDGQSSFSGHKKLIGEMLQRRLTPPRGAEASAAPARFRVVVTERDARQIPPPLYCLLFPILLPAMPFGVRSEWGEVDAELLVEIGSRRFRGRHTRRFATDGWPDDAWAKAIVAAADALVEEPAVVGSAR